MKKINIAVTFLLMTLVGVHPVLGGIEINHVDVNYGLNSVTVSMDYTLDGIEKLYMMFIGGDSIKDRIADMFSGENIEIKSINDTRAVVEIHNCVEFNGEKYIFHGIDLPGIINSITLRFPSGLEIGYEDARGIPQAIYPGF